MLLLRLAVTMLSLVRLAILLSTRSLLRQQEKREDKNLQ
jgi:hypothetical protein